MYKKIFKQVSIAITVLTSVQVTAGVSDLETAEKYRLQFDSAYIQSEVNLYENEQLKKTRLFDIYKTTENRSLVIFKSPADAGQKVLMKAENFWMFMPKSRRPIRITPMQKLLGEASLGDVANLGWSKQYQIKSEKFVDGAIHIELIAKKGNASYQKVSLQIAENDNFPIKADLYLRSGMLSKTATFGRGVINGIPAVTEMVLIDRMRPKNKTVIKYLSVVEKMIPDRAFNPQILVRNDLEKLLAE